MPLFTLCDRLITQSIRVLWIGGAKLQPYMHDDPLRVILEERVAVQKIAFDIRKFLHFSTLRIERTDASHKVLDLRTKCPCVAAYGATDRPGNARELLPASKTAL